MVNRSSFYRWTGAVSAVFLIVVFAGMATGRIEPGADTRRTDIVMIDLPPIPGGEQMPAVGFLHDRHTEALKGKNDCTACHMQEKGAFVFKFKRTKDGDTETDMATYHDNCISCHKEITDSGGFAGPLSGDCRSCHTSRQKIISSRKPVRFDKSLHFRHESSKLIQSDGRADNANCGACHHKFDRNIQQTVYKSGEEETCRYCHKSEKSREARSLQNAFHSDCINCHQQIAGQSEKGGPVNCTGCHDQSRQQKIEVVRDVPRLERNQPDTVLLAGWMTASASGDAELNKHINPVAFNHRVHEAKADDCRSCHHASLERCGECHTEKGSEKGGYVRLEQAMHDTKSEKSCTGCHRQAQRASNCAGCHAQVPEKSFSQLTCRQCHMVEMDALVSLPMSKEAKAQLARKTLNAVSISSVMISDERIPENVTIKGMVDKYEPAQFPHRRIIKKLASMMKEDGMANFFHGKEETTLCAGCHHNSPASEGPPKCASCHGGTFAFKADEDDRPGLKGAYHGQCITCHQKMKIEKPAATDCIGCHKKRT